MATIDINEAQTAQGAKAGSGSADDGTQAIRVAMLDDQPLFIDGVEMAIEHSGDMTMVLRSGSVDHLLHALSRVDADILLMEPWVRSGDGLDGVAAVKAHHPSVAIIALSHWSDAAHVKQVVANGAHGYVSKSTRAADLPSIIRHIATGATVLPSTASRGPGGSDLTPREIEVLALAAEGLSNSEIGRNLFVTEQTVKFHLGNIYRKLGVGNRTEAAHIATRRGLIR